jgi:hypothetical protein
MSVISVLDPTLIQKNLCLHVVIVTLHEPLSVVTEEHSFPNIFASALVGMKNIPANIKVITPFENFVSFIFKRVVAIPFRTTPGGMF